MRRALFAALAALALGLVCAALLSRRTDGAARQLALEGLVPRAALEGRTVAALSIALPGRELSWLHVRSKGRWRSREAFGASSDAAALETLLEELLDARGLVLDAGADVARAFASPELVRLALHGPQVLDAPGRDTLVELEFAPLVGGRALARRAGETRIFDLDRDLVGQLGRLDDPALPPLVDLHFSAASLEPGALGFTRMTIARRAAEPLHIERGAPAPGASDASWTLTQATTRSECPPWRAGGFMGLLLRGTGSGFASPARAAELGLEAPFATLTLEPEHGPTLEWRLSPLQPGGDAWLWNRATNVILRVDAATHALLAPDAAQFLDTARPNPWERWLANYGPAQRN